LSYFTDIVERYPLSGDVQSALAGIETVYQLLNKPQMYLSYLEKVGMSSIKSADEKEQMLFNSAEQLFLTNRYDEALESLNEFIKVYPDGARTPQAYFYLAQTYQKMGKPEFAADAYMKVMSTGDGAFMELATLYYGRVEYELEHFGQAAQAFEKLGEIAQLENNKFEALVGKMRSYYQLKEYDKSIVAAHTVAVSAAADQNIRTEANYVQAKSKYAKGNREEAVPLFEKLVGDYSTAFGAEAAYILALNAYDEGDFEKVENLVYAFSDAGTPHMYWLAKSFIVLGDSFAERGEWEQAKATFESIKDGYTPKNEHDEVLEQVQMRLSKIGNDE
jgi:TolA-binding protein